MTSNEMALMANIAVDMQSNEVNAVLDKIRAEIDGAKVPKNRMSFFRDGIDCALQIIDKYRKSEKIQYR